jgi:small-conductance mechanosensitive channel
MRFKLNIFVYLVLSCVLFGADINSSIVDGNITTYKAILSQIKKDKNVTDEISLEKTLLSELISSDEYVSFSAKDLNTTLDGNSYRMLFVSFIDDIKKLSKLEDDLDTGRKKISAIESEISALKPKDSKLLSYQLQDAYYHKKVKSIQNTISSLNQEIDKIQTLLEEHIKDIKVDIQDVNKSIEDKQKLLSQYQNQISQYQILKEQSSLIKDTRKIARLDKNLKNTQDLYENALKDLISYDYMMFVSHIQSDNDKAFGMEKSITQKILKYKLLQEDEIDTYISPLLLDISKKYLGQIKTLTGASKQEVMDAVYQTWAFVNKPIFNINDTPISIFKMTMALLVFIFGFIVGALYKRKINKLAYSKRSFTPSTKTILANLGYYLIVTIAFFMALNIIGVKLSSIALVAGALSVGIGFGLQNIVSNFVSGLILMFERSVKIGDYIEVDNDTRGYVTDIRMRSTTITTNENIDIIIPNQNFIQNNVINWTMSDNIRRFSVPFGVAYGTDAHQVMQIIKDAVLNSEYRDDIVENSERQTRVIMTQMADSSVNFELLVWIKGDMLHKPKRTASEFLVLIYDALYANNIEIPFPQQDLHIRSIDSSISFK